MACLQCIILRAPMEEASKTTQRLGQVAMARGARLVGTAMVTEKISDVALRMILHGYMCLLIVGVFFPKVAADMLSDL